MVDSAIIKGMPVELIGDDKICIGNECLQITVDNETNEWSIEYDPDSDRCDRRMKKVAKLFLKQVTEGKPKIKFRRVDKG